MVKIKFDELKEKEKNWMFDHPVARGIADYGWTFIVCTLSALCFAFGFNAFMMNTSKYILRGFGHEAMYQKAKAFLDSHIAEAHSIDELNAALNKGGFVKMAFCEKEECELKIKELTNGGTARCLAKEIPAPGTKCPVCGEEAKIVAYFAKAY